MKKQKVKSLLVILPLVFFIITSLTGCVQYNVGVNFSGPNQGEIVQFIKLGERLKSFSKGITEEWLDSIERRAQKLQGKTKRVSEEELVVTIPFNNGRELAAKYNEFFNPTEKKSDSVVSTDVGLPEFKSKLTLNQGNFILWVRNDLQYDLDLRSLTQISNSGSVIVDPGSLLELEFRLTTPGGARSIVKGENAIAPEILADGHQLVWKLQPGTLNHLEAVFWLPSPLGIGALIVALFVAAGIFIKDRLFPNTRKSTSPPIPQS